MALYDYPGGEKGMVSFVEGDIILVQAISPSGWMSGTVLRTGESGLVPSSFVQQVNDCVIVLSDLPVKPKVLYCANVPDFNQYHLSSTQCCDMFVWCVVCLANSFYHQMLQSM